MRIKYVGVKEDGEGAFRQETGIELWKQGDVHDIADPKVASRMLQHPDVFARADVEQAPVPAPAGLTANGVQGEQKQSGEQTPEPVTLEQLADLDDAAVHELAKERKLKVHHASKGDNLRAAFLEAQAKALVGGED